MSDFAIYWKNFTKDCERYRYNSDNPLIDWRTNSQRLFRRLGPGERLWFIASGSACGAAEASAAFLVNAFRVNRIVENTGDDPMYPSQEFRYTVWANRDACSWIDPPLLVDAAVRPGGHESDVHIGKLLQGPRLLGEGIVVHLELLRQNGREPL